MRLRNRLRTFSLNSFLICGLLASLPHHLRASAPQPDSIQMLRYSVRILPGEPPVLQLTRDHQLAFQFPLVSGLESFSDGTSQPEKLSAIAYTVQQASDQSWTITATAQSSLWASRRFEWRFLPDHVEFQQFARGHCALGRAFFLSNGISNRWDNGSAPGHNWVTTLYADKYFAPNPNLANQFEFNTAMPQILGFSQGRETASEQDFRPERMPGTFAPPPLMLAFHQDHAWTSIGIGAKPGQYQFPALEYSGSRYAGASFFVDYMGYRSLTPDSEFASPSLSIHFAYDPLDVLEKYTAWLDASGFSTPSARHEVAWHHLPIFCGWAQQTVESVPLGRAPNKLATQANYEKWIATLEARHLPIGTIVIDDKWQSAYGGFEVDKEKWPDMKAFVTAQHAAGRHVLLWVPVAHQEGLPDQLCLRYQGKCAGADLGNPAYEEFLRPRIRHLVQDIGVDGFKEDWVGAPALPGLALTTSDARPAFGIEYFRRFQSILWSETHRWKLDALVETQSTNALFRESSDVIRLNDIWYATRNVPDVLRLRARMAFITGWPLVDTDNASSTTLSDWWSYMQAQPSIGIPALYFTTLTEATQEAPSDQDWASLAALWRRYIQSLPTTMHNP